MSPSNGGLESSKLIVNSHMNLLGKHCSAGDVIQPWVGFIAMPLTPDLYLGLKKLKVHSKADL
jgi:hypothetical protein